MIKRLADEETAGEKSAAELRRNLGSSRGNMVKPIGEETKYGEMITDVRDRSIDRANSDRRRRRRCRRRKSRR